MTTHPLFRRVAVAAIALSLGVMAGFLVAVRRINPALEIHVGPLAIAAGIVAGGAAPAAGGRWTHTSGGP